MLLICLFFAILILGGAFVIYWENNTKNKARAVIEDSSVIHLFRDDLDSETTDLEIQEMFKNLTMSGGYNTPFCRRYNAPGYTLMGYRGNFLQAHFAEVDGKVGNLTRICWQYEKGDAHLYTCFLQYLTGMLGDPIAKENGEDSAFAQWHGCRLQRNRMRIEFIRQMDR